MKSALIAAALTSVLAPAAVAQLPQQRVPDRQVELPPLPGFVPGYSKRVGRQSIVEFVPRGQTVQRYSKMVTLTTFPVAPGMTEAAVLGGFAKRYQAACGGTTVSVVPLGNGRAGVRMDCSRNPTTGKRETVFARAVSMNPEMAIVQYMTTYLTMPAEAQFAREFLGKVTVR